MVNLESSPQLIAGASENYRKGVTDGLVDHHDRERHAGVDRADLLNSRDKICERLYRSRAHGAGIQQWQICLLCR